MDSMKNLLEVLRFLPLLNLGGKYFQKVFHKYNYNSEKVVVYIFFCLIFAKLGTYFHFIVNRWKRFYPSYDDVNFEAR